MTVSHLASMMIDAKQRGYNYSDSEDTDTGGTEQSLNESFTSLQVSIVLLSLQYALQYLSCMHRSFHSKTLYMHCTIAAPMLLF
jgi:hypothetical protein